VSYIAHKALVATFYHSEYASKSGTELVRAFEELRAEMPENLRRHLIGPVKATSNGYVSFLMVPEGSSGYYPTHREMETWRERFFNTATKHAADVAWLTFGGDTEQPEITAHRYGWERDEEPEHSNGGK